MDDLRAISPTENVILPTLFWEGAGKRIAYKKRLSKQREKPGVLYINGLNRDMEEWSNRHVWCDAKAGDYTVVAFDFHGVGKSSSVPGYRTSPISWLEDAINVLDHVCGAEQQVLVGYFTGAWVALHVALQRPTRVKALVLCAPGIDMTSLWWQHLKDEDRQKCRQLRKVPLPGAYGQGGKTLPFSFFEEAEGMLLMTRPSIPITKPVRIIQGLKDTIVPPALSRELIAKLEGEEVQATLIKNHNLVCYCPKCSRNQLNTCSQVN